MYEIVVTPHAVRDLKKLPREVLKRIDRVLLELGEPHTFGIKRLKDHRIADWRIRAGDYRVLFDIDEVRKTVVILRVGHRKDIYR